MICTNCYASGEAKKHTPGGGAITFLQLASIVLLFVVPIPRFMFGTVVLGVILFIVLLAVVASATRKSVCRNCGSLALVPEDSPRGLEIRAQHPSVADRAAAIWEQSQRP